MICKNCGTNNANDAKFCVSCGQSLGVDLSKDSAANNAVPNNAAAGEHPYNQLGGWLMLFTYGSLLALAYAVWTMGSSAFTLFKYMQYMGFKSILFSFGAILLLVPYSMLIWKMYTMIKAKNPLFLKTYETTMLYSIGINVVLVVFSFMLFGYVNIGSYVKESLETLIVFGVWLAYFSKSVRVRTYFGTDAYLRQSIFLKNSQAPNPAE